MRQILFHLLVFVLTTHMAAAQQGQTQGQLPQPGAQSEEARQISKREIATHKSRPEFIVSAPRNQANAVAARLQAEGAVLLRRRELPNLRLTLLIYDFERRLNLRRAREAVPGIPMDIHALYRYAAGAPRLYAANLVGDAAPGRCRVSGSRKIGIIDGPVNARHPALAGARVVSRTMRLKSDKAAKPDHGTAVAALIVGEDASGALAGFAPGATLYAAAAFAQERGRDAADVERIGAALDWQVGQGVKLVNMSFAGPRNIVLAELLRATGKRGTAMIAAVGNAGSKAPAWPAAAPEVVAVTAVDASGRAWRSANQGAEFAAPGVDVYVAKGGSGSYASGTSYAAPIATALAARKGASGSVARVRSALRKGVADLGTSGPDSRYGWGLIQGGC